MKRTMDLVGAVLGLLLLWPLILVLVLLIRAGSAGPGIFSQERVGRDGRLFRCLKLRTMETGVPNVPTHEAEAAYITPIGSFLRRYKLDELPQLWNVIKGEMSFVGPRPCLPNQTQLIQERASRGVLAIRPGITGLAQIEVVDMSDPVRLAQKDAQYLRERSLRRDLSILFKTFLRLVGSGDRVRA